MTGGLSLNTALDRARQYSDWLDDQLDELELSNSQPKQLAYASLAVALAHSRGVIILLEHDLFPCAFALIRPQFDAYCRGMWLAYCATENDIENLLNQGDPPNTERLITALEVQGFLEAGVLSGIRSKIWGTLGDFTHTGIRQMSRQITNGELSPACDVEDKIEALHTSAMWAGLAGISIAEIGGKQEVAEQICRGAPARLSEFAAPPMPA